MTEHGNDGTAAVRRRVSKSYARLVSNPPGACCDRPAESTAAMGYDPAVIASLPNDAVTNAFGCGSPVSFSDLAPGDVVLDLGCGAGIDLLQAAAKVGPAGLVIGVDMTDVMVQRARENAATAGVDNVEVRLGIIEDLPVESASVDWVISNCVINLSPEKQRVFAEMARVLRPGGRLRVADILAEDLPEWVLLNHGLYNSCLAGAISEHEYVAGLRMAGLGDVAIDGRYVYDRDQLAGLIADGVTSDGDGRRLADALAGRVWSAYVSARKAASTEARRREGQP